MEISKINYDEVAWKSAFSKGIVEIGSVTLGTDKNEYHIDIEESNIQGWYRFSIFLTNPDQYLNPEKDPDTGEITDPEFIQYIKGIYQEYSPL